MKKMKRILSLVAAAILSLGIFLFASCGKETAYTIIVTLPDGTPVEGVRISLCYDDGNCLPPPQDTDAEGKAVFEHEPFAYHITIDEYTLPEGYTAPDEHTPEAYGTVTIELIATVTAE